jgi:hypothetical protein
MKKPKIFISWSGERSRAVAEELHRWLPEILQFVDPFLSTQDIEKGAKWAQVLSGALEGSTFSIICLTPENLTSPWLLFEAGAVAKRADSRVYTYLIDVPYTDVKDPLSQFQHTRADKGDTEKLIIAINRQLGEAALDKERLKNAFERLWPSLEERLASLPPPSEHPTTTNDPITSLVEMSSEILERIREQSRKPRVDFLDDEEHIEFASIVIDMLVDQLKGENTDFKAVALRRDGDYTIVQKTKAWVVAKLIAEDCAIGRITLSELFSKSVQNSVEEAFSNAKQVTHMD